VRNAILVRTVNLLNLEQQRLNVDIHRESYALAVC